MECTHKRHHLPLPIALEDPDLETLWKDIGKFQTINTL